MENRIVKTKQNKKKTLCAFATLQFWNPLLHQGRETTATTEKSLFPNILLSSDVYSEHQTGHIAADLLFVYSAY